MTVSGEQMHKGLNKLQEFVDKEFVGQGWSPAETVFMLAQLQFTYHLSIDVLIKRRVARGQD